MSRYSIWSLRSISPLNISAQRNDPRHALFLKLRRSVLHGNPFSYGSECSKSQISEGENHVEIVEVVLVMRVMMRVEPAEPCCLLNPTSLGHMHAEMEILIEEVIKAERQHSWKENSKIEKRLTPKEQGRMQTKNQRRVPPCKPDLPEILSAREKISLAGTKDTVVDQGVRAKGVRPERLVHQETMEKPFEEAGIEKKRDKSQDPRKM